MSEINYVIYSPVAPTPQDHPDPHLGPPGPAGPQGYQGPPGTGVVITHNYPQGYQGYQGYQGASGFGYQGVQGATGPSGAGGVTGAVGPQGYRGYQGVGGTNGTNGSTGAPGPQGVQGVQGYQGEIGCAGPQGVQGAGVQGSQGDVGPSGGPQGYQGVVGVGVQGYQGVVGSQGDVGVVGPTGPQGYQGSRGVQGDYGIQGYQGGTGPTGPQGYQGSGSQGPAGVVGATGPQGSQGYQGVSGSAGTMEIGFPVVSGLAKSVLFVDASGDLGNNPNGLVWDDGTHTFKVKAKSGQTANLTEWWDSGGSVLSWIDSGGNLIISGASVNTDGTFLGAYLANSSGTLPYIDVATLTNTIGAVGRTAGQVPWTVKGVVSQTGDLQQWQESTGAVAASFGADRSFNFDSSNLFKFQLGGAPKNTVLFAVTPSSFSDNDVAYYCALPVVTGLANAMLFRGTASTGMHATLENQDAAHTTANSKFVLSTQATGGSPFINFNVASVTNWQVGIDNADSDAFKISCDGGGSIGATVVIRMTTGGTTMFTPQAAGNVGAIVKGFMSQTSDLQQWQNSSGTNLVHVLAGGQVNALSTLSVGGGFTSALNSSVYALFVQPTTATVIPIVTRGAASQSADLQQWQDSTGAVLAKVDALGNATVGALFATSISHPSATGTFLQTDPAGIFINPRNPASDLFTCYVQSVFFPFLTPTIVPVVVRGAVSQSADLQQWQDNTGATLASVAPSGKLVFSDVSTADRIQLYSSYGIGMDGASLCCFANASQGFSWRKNSTSGDMIAYLSSTKGTLSLGLQSTIAQLYALTYSSTTVGIIVQGAASQSADLQQWQDSTGTTQANVYSDGTVSSVTEFRLNSSYSRVAQTDGGGGFVGGYNININGGTPKHDSTGGLAGVWYTLGGISFYTNTSAAAGTTAPKSLFIDPSGDILARSTIAPGSGVTGTRPTVTNVGAMWFDITLGIPIWWDGSNWIDATGTTV